MAYERVRGDPQDLHRRRDDRHRVVLDGLEESDAVVLFPGDTIEDGDLVEGPGSRLGPP